MFHRRRFLHKIDFFFCRLNALLLQTLGAAALGTSAGPQRVTKVDQVFPFWTPFPRQHFVDSIFLTVFPRQHFLDINSIDPNQNDLVQEVALITEQSAQVFPVSKSHGPVG